jgi:formamidopyrimidine-DNA glycosylase
MPELPEAERARQQIEKVLNREIVAVDDADTYVCRPHAPGDICDALLGRSLTEAHRRGKFLWVETSEDGPDLGLHLGMAGSIVIDSEPAPNGWDRFSLEFAGGGRMALRDKRRLGRAVIEPDFDHVGPDAGEVSAKEFRDRIGRGSAPIKAKLLDQGAIAGVGNLLADEVLWQAKVSPRTVASDISRPRLNRLYEALQASIAHAIAEGGVHKGEIIGFRRAGAECPRDGAGMTKATIGGRTTWWCPRCQR